MNPARKTRRGTIDEKSQEEIRELNKEIFDIYDDEDLEQLKENHVFLIALITENMPQIIKFYDLKKGIKIGELATFHHEPITCFAKSKDY